MSFNHPIRARMDSFATQTLLALALCGMSSSSSFAQVIGTGSAILRPGDNLKIEGVPNIPMSLVDKVRKYTEARGASVLDRQRTECAFGGHADLAARRIGKH